jgi:hypothetical protein
MIPASSLSKNVEPVMCFGQGEQARVGAGDQGATGQLLSLGQQQGATEKGRARKRAGGSLSAA